MREAPARPASKSMLAALILAGASVAIVATFALAFGAPSDPDAPDADTGADAEEPLLVQDDGPLRYVFHAVMGTETLYDRVSDPACLRNLARERPDDLLRLRAALLRARGAADLATLQEPYAVCIARLRGLGYL